MTDAQLEPTRSALTNDRQGYPERIIPDETAPGILAIHLKRYDFARSYATGKHVLDVACGVGYGSRHLADVAASVTGVDLDPDAVAYARRRYSDVGNIRFLQGDALNLPFSDRSFEVICSFETIEHVPDAQRFLKEVKRLLVPGGIFIVSTPAARHSTASPANPHHVQEWSPRDFKALLGDYFEEIQIFSQVRRTTRVASLIKRLDFLKVRTRVPLGFARRVAASAGVSTMADISMDDIFLQPSIKPSATEVVAVCTKTNR
jgi:2-polyprenyl-3-methyl-5-hydroxy-6-metoxy-1,4-benzoquinol methylase